MLVQGLAHDDAGQVDLAQPDQGLEVLELADPPGVQEAPAHGAGDVADLLQVRPLEHPVPVHVGVDELVHAAGLQPCHHVRHRHLGGLGPARGGHHAPAHVHRDQDPLAVGAENLVQEVDVGVGRGPQDDPGGPGAQRVAHSRERAQPAPVLDRNVDRRGDPRQVAEVHRLARPCSVEVDHVQEPGSLAPPGAGRLERIGLVDRRLREVPLDQPDGLALVDVHRRIEDHERWPGRRLARGRGAERGSTR